MRSGSATISPTGQHRIERGIRILEDVLHLPAHLAHARRGRGPVIVCAVEADAAAGRLASVP